MPSLLLILFHFLANLTFSLCTSKQGLFQRSDSPTKNQIDFFSKNNHHQLTIKNILTPFPTFSILRLSDHHTLWKTPSDDITEAFLILGSAEQEQPPINNGNYQVNYTLTKLTNSININSITQSVNNTDATESVNVVGDLLYCLVGSSERKDASCEKRSDFTLSFIFPSSSTGRTSSAVISFSVELIPTAELSLSSSEIHTILTLSAFEEESFHGFGESFTYFNLAGFNVPILVSEQGVGRGEQPITDYLNQNVGEGVGGHWYTTYAPKPLFVTNYNRSLGLEITHTSFFDLTQVDTLKRFTIDVWTNQFKGQLLNRDSFADTVSSISDFTGKQAVLPAWTQQGAIVGLEGGTANVTRIVNELLAGGVPIVGVWLQDWVGLRHSWDGDRLIWNWELNNDYYPEWEEMTSNWKKQGIRVLTYLNPFFSDPSGFVDEKELRHNFYQEGLANQYFVKKADGSTYLMNSLSIEFATLDLTNPEARRWMKSIIINQTLIEANSSGWMCDFGEYLPFDAVMYNGETGASYHNYYPQAWAELTAEAIQEYNEQRGIKESQIMFFMRSAWTWSPAYVPAFWLGDQLMSWDSNDGIKTVITGALSSGLTGHTITHSDIGGYNAEINVDGTDQMDYIRSPELLKRWSELSAFGFGLFRTHIGSSTNPIVAQIYDTPDSIQHFARFASIYAQLSEYRAELMQEAATKGLPMIRPLSFYYGYDKESCKVVSEYLMGDQFLVAPCMTAGANQTTVYFPAYSGVWYYLWDKTVSVDMSASPDGLYKEFDSPIGYPAVFYKEQSSHGEKLQRYLSAGVWTK